MVTSRHNHWESDTRGSGPQERFFKHLLRPILNAMALADTNPVPGTRKKPMSIFRDYPGGRCFYWLGHRLTPAEFRHLRDYANALWRVKELPEGSKHRIKWEAEAKRCLSRVPLYLRKMMSVPMGVKP